MIVNEITESDEIAFFAADAQDLHHIFANFDIKLHLQVKFSSLDNSFVDTVTQWLTSLGYSNEYAGYYNTWQADLDTINWEEIEKHAAGVDPLSIEDANIVGMFIVSPKC